MRVSTPLLLMLGYLVGTTAQDDFICLICGGGMSTQPNGTIDLGDGLTTCAAVFTAAQEGLFNETFCDEVVQPTAKEPCGCTDPPPPTPAPVGSLVPTADGGAPSTTPPTLAPVDDESTAPSADGGTPSTTPPTSTPTSSPTDAPTSGSASTHGMGSLTLFALVMFGYSCY